MAAGSARTERGGGPHGFNVRATARHRATCSAICSAAAGAAARGGGAVVRARSAATTSRRADARLRRRRARHHDVAVPHQRRGQCSTCHGSGARPGTTPKTCPRVPAAASSTTTRGFSRSRSPCRNCGGRGASIEDPCPTCHGSGVERRRTRGEGAHPRRRRRRPADPAQGPGRARPQRRPAGRPVSSSATCAPAHDLRPQRPRPHGQRAGHVPEAALGAEIEVPTLDGRPVTLRLKPGTQTGSTSPREGQGRRHRKKRPATCSSRSRSRCRTTSDRRARAAIEALAARRRHASHAESTWPSEARSDD